MSVLCRYCGNRVASVASLAGHYRRKHPERATAGGRAAGHGTGLNPPRAASRIGPDGGFQRVSDSAYIAALERGRLAEAEGQQEGGVAPFAAQPDARFPQWGRWLLVAGLIAFVLIFIPDSDGGGRAASDLVSNYQPEGNGQ